MSYNKFLNKILNNQRNGNVLTFNTQNQSLSFKSNIQISQLQNENIKIESNDLNTLVFSKTEGINSALAFQENLNYSKLKISDFSFENSGDNKLFLLKNENSKIRVNSDLEISSSDFKAKKIYGNLTYVDKERTIPWLSGSNNETVKVSFNPTGGYTINKQNINLNNTTYITCNPDDGFSNYPKTDIAGEQSNGYNFVNELGSYTNILYLRPGLNSNNKSRYLSSNEHTFIIDVQKSKLPGWGFEENHPLRKMASYNSLYNTIMNSSNLQNQLKSQSIAIDLSDLVNSNSIRPGYRVNFCLRNVYTPVSQPCIFHSDTNISLNQSDWDQYTFDSRYCNFTKSDYENNLNIKNLNSKNFSVSFFYQTLSSAITNTLYTGTYYLNPYISNVNPSFTANPPNDKYTVSKYSAVASTKDQNLNGTNKEANRVYYSPVGSYSSNKFSCSYFKSFFYFNLGKNNIILNEISNKEIKKNIENFKIDHIPYLTNSNEISSFFSNILNNNNVFEYFIDYKKRETHDDLNIDMHLNEIDQNFYTNKSPVFSNANSAYSVFNCKKNLTIKLNFENFQKIKDNFQKIFLFQEKRLDDDNWIKAFQSQTFGSTQTWPIHFYRKLIKSTNVLIFPFNNLSKTINSNDSYHSDWRYIDQWQTRENICNQFDLSVNNNLLETQFGINNANTIPLNLSQTANYINNLNTQYQFSLMYFGFNSTTNKHEWVYV